MMHIEPVTLQGHLVRLEPLRMEHASEIYDASRDPSLWTYKPVKQPQSLLEMEQLVASTLQNQNSDRRATPHPANHHPSVANALRSERVMVLT